MKIILSLVCVCLLMSAPAFARHGKGDPKQTDAKAVYLVPVPPKFAVYSLFADVRVRVREFATSEFKFEYSLPLELTGVENKIEFSGQPDATGKVMAYGDNGQASCDVQGGLQKCQIIYKEIVFDNAARTAFLTKLSKGNQEELAARMAVADIFEQMVLNDPAYRRSLSEKVTFSMGLGEPHGILQLVY